MRPHRREKIESLIQEELAKILLRDVEFPLGTLVTISYVNVSSDLSEAKIGVSVMPQERTARVIEVLGKLRGFIQTSLTRKMNIMPMPHIVFEIDRGSENAARVEKLLREAGGV
jgi:ribosome-binding factor A